MPSILASNMRISCFFMLACFLVPASARFVLDGQVERSAEETVPIINLAQNEFVAENDGSNGKAIVVMNEAPDESQESNEERVVVIEVESSDSEANYQQSAEIEPAVALRMEYSDD